VPDTPTSLESPDSSSPIVTRAAAAALRGETCENYLMAPWQRTLLRSFGRAPQGLGRFAIARFQTLSGLAPERLDGLSIETLAAERLRDYGQLTGRCPAITIGAALGGASAHLALALGGPFLPQAFVATLKGGSPDGDPQVYLTHSAERARRIARDNPLLLTIQHFDPVHDGWLTRHVNHLRFKLLGLPHSYAAFIRKTLEPGGAICFLDCQARWLRYRVGERSVFQVGGWGDVSAQEFLEGSPRLEAYARSTGLRCRDWKLPGYPLEAGPESEWGVEPGLGEALESFCQQEGYRFVRIRLPEPHDYSRLAFEAYARLLEKESQQPQGVFIEMFTQFDASAVLRGGLLPLWLIFNTQDSLAFLKSMRPRFPSGRPVFFSPLITFSLTPDLTPWAEWETALHGLDWRNVGTRPSHYPSDTLRLTDWAAPLRRWVADHPQPIQGRLSAEELLDLAHP
jgi:hypothetical protein